LPICNPGHHLVFRSSYGLLANAAKRWMVDAAIVGYPKCGNTWFSALVRHYLAARHGLPLQTVGKSFISDPDGSKLPLVRLEPRLPRLYHTHSLPYPHEYGLRGVRSGLAPLDHAPMVVLYRDPKDVLVSYYHHEVFRGPHPRFQGDADAFVSDPVFGVGKLVAYYNAVAASRRRSAAPTGVTRYEDLWSDPQQTLQRSLELIGIEDICPRALGAAVEACSIANMRRMECAADCDTALVPGLFRSCHDRPEALKVREGGTGGWRKSISEASAERIDCYVAANIDPMFLDPAR